MPFFLFWISPAIFSLVSVFLGVIGIVLTTVAYIRIYLAVGHHKSQIQAHQVQQETQTEEMANFARLIKSTVGISTSGCTEAWTEHKGPGQAT